MTSRLMTIVDPRPVAVQPTAEQQRAIDALLAGVANKAPEQRLGGYAGTGKTTVIRHLKERLPTFAVCAYTGKAASVLRRKGVEASTIHRLIYEVDEDEETGEVTFRPRQSLPCAGIIVDEASMVGLEIHRSLRNFGIPLIFVGDHGQLEPVSSDLNLMRDPDHRLETIHRNGGEISRFAEWLRMGREPRDFPAEEARQVEFVSRREIEGRGLWTGVDQIICAYNKTRVGVNALVRRHLGHTGAMVTIGERVMCLRNNQDRGLFNGLQGTVLAYRRIDDRHLMDIESSCGETYRGVPIHPDQFGQEKTLLRERKGQDGGNGNGNDNGRGPFRLQNILKCRQSFEERNPFDYAYCVTCHKAQGDEFDAVMVLEQRCSAWEHSRWTYTAASRARRKLYWVQGF